MFLGLDLGTSNVKVLVVDRDGRIVARGAAPVARWTTSDGGVLQDIDQIWEATCQAIGKAVVPAGVGPVEAVGVSAQGGALQLLDAREQPLGRVLSWLDGRGKPFDRQIEEQWGRPYLLAHTGRGFSTTTLGQIARLRHESPETLQSAAAIGYVGDVIVGRLCGRRAHDATSLSLAMLYNPVLDAVDPELLARLKIDDKRLPELLKATEPAGRLQASAARCIGLGEGIPVSPAVHDQYAAALGAGVVAEGDVLVGTGTAWVLLAVAGRLAPPAVSRAFVCAHPVAGLFGQLLSLGGAGAQIESALEAAGQRDLDQESLDAMVASVPPGAEGLCFSPEFDAATPCGTFSGGDPARSAGHRLRAVFEGLARELARHLDRFTRAGLPVKRLVVAGPAAASRALPQIVADVTGRPVTCVNQPATSAWGAAALARTMVDAGNKLSDVARTLAPWRCAFSPGADAPWYRRQWREYLEAVAKNDLKE